MSLDLTYSDESDVDFASHEKRFDSMNETSGRKSRKSALNADVDLKSIEGAVRTILEAVGEDPNRDGLLDTPARVARMYAEMSDGEYTLAAIPYEEMEGRFRRLRKSGAESRCRPDHRIEIEIGMMPWSNCWSNPVPWR